VQGFDLPPMQRAFEANLFALEQALARQAELHQEIVALAEAAPYREPVGWLRCFRGIDMLSAIILLAEVVDFQRFEHPRELMAYLGLVPSAYFTGETRRRGGSDQGRRRTRPARPRRARLALSPSAHGGSPTRHSEARATADRRRTSVSRSTTPAPARHLVGRGKRPPVAAPGSWWDSSGLR
jgi:transposase